MEEESRVGAAGGMEAYSPLIAAWLDDAFETTRIGNPASIHLDALLRRTVPEAEQIALACAVMRVIVGMDPGRYLAYAPILSIALEDTDATTVLPPPKTEEMLHQQWRRVEPPSFLVLKRQWRTYQSKIERYACPLPFDLFPDNEGIYSYYSTARSLSAMRAGEEYGRWVEAEYYPPELRLG